MRTPVRVITAISDSDLDGKIASMIRALGWSLIFRAFTLEASTQSIDQETPDLVLVDSENELEAPHKVGNSAVRYVTVTMATTLEQLSQLEHSEELLEKVHVSRFVTAIPVVAFASLERLQGTSTLALEYATAQHQNGIRTLLIDAHLSHPFLASYFEVHGINRDIRITSDGLRIFECGPTISLEQLQENLKGIDMLVIDFGVLPETEYLSLGARAQEKIVRTFAPSISQLHLVTDTSHLNGSIAIRDALLDIRFARSIDIYLNRIQSRKDIAVSPEVKARFVEDKRAVMTARKRNSAVAAAAPRSPLVREMHRLINEPSITRFSKD